MQISKLIAFLLFKQFYMNYKYLLFPAMIIGFIAACSSSKKTTKTSEPITMAEPAIDLDTIKVLAEEPPKKKI